MKRALILYWHGLGDVIMLTPHLRHLHDEGYMTDLMCRPEVRTSKLLDDCPYVDNLIDVPNPWQSKLGFAPQAKLNIERFQSMRKGYDWAGASPHRLHKTVKGIHKIDMTSQELGLNIKDKRLEVFIPPETDKPIGNSYIFVHRLCEWHPYHNWDPYQWIKENLPPLDIVYTDDGGKPKMYDNINKAFELARCARHRIIASSVFVPACDAMGCTIDAINYGRADCKTWPLVQSKVLHIREAGEWIK